MVKKCCVPACGGNYDKDRKVTVFSFPMHDLRRVEQWKRKIPRQWNFEVTKETVVCERHFSDHQILRTETFKRPDGSSVTVPRNRCKLTDDACPHIFTIAPSGCATNISVPHIPSYLSSDPSPKRQKPRNRHQEESDMELSFIDDVAASDKIKNFQDLKDNIELDPNQNDNFEGEKPKPKKDSKKTQKR